MSYILEALKKSQLEHARGRVPTLDALPPPAAVAGRRNWPALLAAVAAGALVATLGLRGTPGEAPTPIVAPVVAPAGPAMAATPVAPAVAAGPSAPVAAAAAAGVDPPAAPPAAVPPPAPPKPAPARPVPRPLAAGAVGVVVWEGPPPPAAPVELPTAVWHQLPDAVRGAIGPLEVNVHVYADEPARRFVFINGRQYGEGSTLREGPLLEQIVPTGVVLEYAGDRFRIDVTT